MMKREANSDQATRRRRPPLAAGLLLGALLAVTLTSIAAPALADSRHNPKRSGHPLRVIAYVLHPVGWLIDTVVFRPAHWVVSREPLEPVFGHTERD